jgi:hypothetical protein
VLGHLPVITPVHRVALACCSGGVTVLDSMLVSVDCVTESKIEHASRGAPRCGFKGLKAFQLLQMGKHQVQAVHLGASNTRCGGIRVLWWREDEMSVGGVL